MCRRGTNAYTHRLDFQYNNFGNVFSIVKKWPLLVNFNIKKIKFSMWVWDFVDIYLTHLGTRIKWCAIHAYLKQLFFGLQNSIVPHWHKEKKLFSSNLNFMISQMVRNECVKFGRHVNGQVNYKILWLKVPNNAQTLHKLPGFW
jgi:hypothetical protein